MKEKNDGIDILILCSFYSSYVIQLCHYMKNYYPQIKYSLLTHKSAVEEYRKESENLENIYYYVTTRTRLFYDQLDMLPSFDIIHSLWMEPAWGINVRLLKSKAKFWFNSVGGSDLYRFSSNPLVKVMQKRIIRRSDWISSENIETRNFFYKIYGDKYRTIEHSICRFGVDILDYISLFKKGEESPGTIRSILPEDKIIILCGTNASEHHQHLAIIDAISRMNDLQRNQCHFVFPMTYPKGKEAYINRVSEYISRITDSFTILTRYMDVREMAELAMVTDVMVHVQTSDQLSSAMLSQMYNGNLVIAGAWLPYDSLRDNNVFFLKVGEIPELTSCMEDVVINLDDYKKQCMGNPDIVYRLSSWEMASVNWMNIYTSLMKGEK